MPKRPFLNFLLLIGRLTRYRPPSKEARKAARCPQRYRRIPKAGEIDCITHPYDRQALYLGPGSGHCAPTRGRRASKSPVFEIGRASGQISRSLQARSMIHDRFHSREYTTGFIAKEYPDGFIGRGGQNAGVIAQSSARSAR